jgi:hypothetical protein
VGPTAGLDTEARGKILSSLPRNEPRSPVRKLFGPKMDEALWIISNQEIHTALLGGLLLYYGGQAKQLTVSLEYNSDGGDKKKCTL